jgi:predicted methyltransferase
MKSLLALAALTLALPAPLHAAPDAAPDYAALVAAADRDAADKKDDAGRKPVAMLTFLDVRPGQKVAEIGAGGGYTTELLARAVGPTGTVYGVNNKMVVEKFVKKPWADRLAKPVNKNVVRVDREFDDPLPPEARNLDLVVNNLFYHDTYWLKTNRRKMNAAILKALRPGGAYVIIDHSAAAGHGSKDTESLHRVEESLVRKEVLAAGFKAGPTSDFLRNPDDKRDVTVFDKAIRGNTDRFALKFLKK